MVETKSVYSDPDSMKFNASIVSFLLALAFLIVTIVAVVFMRVSFPRPELNDIGAIAAVGSVILAITCAFGGILEIRRQIRKRDKLINKLDGILVQRGGFSGF